MIRVHSAADASERLQAATAFLDAIPPATEVLIVGASRDAADDLARRLTIKRGATFGLHRASLIQLAVRCTAVEMARASVAPATALGMEALAARISFEAVRDHALPYFAPVARLPGFAGAVAATLAELRLTRIPSAALDKSEGASRDVAELLRRFETTLADAKIADRATLFSIATRAVTDGALDPLWRMPMLFLDVSMADLVEFEFVDGLTALSPDVLVTVPAGDDATLDAVRALASRRGGLPSIDASGASGPDVNAASRSGVNVSPGRGPADSDLGRARAFVFAAAAPPPRIASGDVVLFSAPGEARETVEIARRILEEARNGTRFDEMAVLLRAPAVYGSLMQAALQRAGVPAYFTRGAARPDPSGRAFLALLDCALEGLSARRFAEYLSLGQVPALDATGAPPADRVVWTAPEDETLGPVADAQIVQTSSPAADQADAGIDSSAALAPDVPTESSLADQLDADERPVVDGTLRAPWKWEQLLVESAVIGGKDRWARRLAGLEAQYRVKLAEVRATEPDSPRVAAIERDLGNLEHLRRFAIPVIERLSAMPSSGTWGEWIAALETLVPIVLRRPERVLTVLAALRPLDVIGPVALAEVREVLAEELTTIAERPPADRYGRVFVGTIEQARGRSFEVVFLPGLAERIFPQKPREDPILLDALRRDLAALTTRDRGTDADSGVSLVTQEERGQRERLMLRIAVGATRLRLHLSYSRIEQIEARPRVPSFYALEMVRAITGHVPEPQAMERDAAAAAGARLAWPAPDDPQHAIDEVEHDLATLRRLIASGEARGRARYLFELNECLMRSLRTQWARWRRSFSPYDGVIRVADGTRETLGGSRLSARPYSASALQKFAACPYQFFLSAILRLEPREDVESIVQIDPATRGHLFHRVQADVMRALADEGQLPLKPDALDAPRATLDRTLDRVTDKYREELVPAIRRVWQDEVESMRADLRMWLELSAADHATWEPIAFELAFGLKRDPENDPRSVEAEVTVEGGSRLRGIVDLVERRHGAAELRVTDYKTGQNWTKRKLVVGGGEMLQPVLYALAMEQVLSARVVESRLFYCTRAGGFSEAVVPMTSEARSRGLDVLGGIDRAIASGFLPAAPRRRACGICDFRDVCGPHEEDRTKLKDQLKLAELIALRDTP